MAAELALLLAYSFTWGLRKGSTICATVCAPGLIPYIAERRLDWKEGFKVGLIFNLPRILLLTAIGAIVGYVSFALLSNPDFENATVGIGIIAYFFVGILLLFYGIYTFTKAAEDRKKIKKIQSGDMKGEGNQEEDLNKACYPHTRAILFFTKKFSKQKQEGFFLITWGSLLGMACIGETIIAFESALLGGVVASLGNDPFAAMLLGALVLFIFSIGAALPVILVTTTSGRFSDRIKTREILNKIQTIGSVVMIMIGLVLVFMFFGRII